MLRIGEALPHNLAWCVEHTRDDKRGDFRGGHHRHSYSVGVFNYCCSYFGSTMTIQFTPNLSCVMRVAQLVVAPVVRAQILEVATLDKTERGSGGFGSTGS